MLSKGLLQNYKYAYFLKIMGITPTSTAKLHFAKVEIGSINNYYCYWKVFPLSSSQFLKYWLLSIPLIVPVQQCLWWYPLPWLPRRPPFLLGSPHGSTNLKAPVPWPSSSTVDRYNNVRIQLRFNIKCLCILYIVFRDCNSGQYEACMGSEEILYAWAKNAPPKYLPKGEKFFCAMIRSKTMWNRPWYYCIN